MSGRMVVVVWFNDYRTTKMYRTQLLYKFLNNYDEYSKNFNKTIGLKTAAQEALIYLGTTMPSINLMYNINSDQQ